MYIFRRLLIRLLLISSLVALVLWAIPHFVDIDSYRIPVLTRLNQHLGIRLSAGRIGLVLIPHAGIRIHGLSLSLPGETTPFAEAEEAELRLVWKSALNEIRDVILFSAHADFHVHQDPFRRWNFQQAFQDPGEMEPPQKEPPRHAPSKLEQEINARSHEIAVGRFHPETKRSPSRKAPGVPSPVPLKKERPSIFEKVSLQKVEIVEASIAEPSAASRNPLTMRNVKIRPTAQGWLLKGNAEPRLFSMFSCSKPGPTLSLSLSKNGVACSKQAQID